MTSQLSDIDVAQMGSRFRTAILQARRQALPTLGHTDEQIDEALRDLDQALEGINFTTIALHSLDENIFKRALAVIRADFADQPLIMAHLLHTVGITLDALGLRDRAEAPVSAVPLLTHDIHDLSGLRELSAYVLSSSE